MSAPTDVPPPPAYEQVYPSLIVVPKTANNNAVADNNKPATIATSTIVAASQPSSDNTKPATMMGDTSNVNGGNADGANKNAWFSGFSNSSSVNVGSIDDGDATSGGNGVTVQNAAAWLGQRRSGLRAWGEFFRTSKFGIPSPMASVLARIQHNLSYFFSNYLCVFLVLMVYCVLTSFVMLLTLIAMCGLFYTIRQRLQKGPIVLGGQELPPSLLYTLAIMLCIPLFALADVGQVMYWVLGTGVFLIVLHAALYECEEKPGADFEVVTVT